MVLVLEGALGRESEIKGGEIEMNASEIESVYIYVMGRAHEVYKKL